MALFSSSMETHCLQDLDSYLQEFDQMQESADQMEMSTAMARLKYEFCYLLSGYATPSSIDESWYYTDSSCSSTPMHFRFSISSDISELDEVDMAGGDYQMGDYRIYYLRCIAERVIASGFTHDCVESYSRIRHLAINARLMELGIEARNTSRVQMLEQQMQARNIRQWIKAARELIETIFANEKLMIQYIFNGLTTDEDVEEICFAMTVKSPAFQLLNFAERISTVPTQSAPERLFPVLDLYEALSQLLPAIKTMFRGKYVHLGPIYEQAEHLLLKLADTAKGMLAEFEKSVQNETACKATQTGDVLPLTRYVMDFLTTMAVFRQPLTRLIISLNELIVSKPSGNPSMPEMDFSEFEEQTTAALHLIWIILILHSNLEAKSKHYKDVSLSHLFMMNNVHFIVQEITDSPELRETVGDAYVKILRGKYRHDAMSYLRSTWAKVLHCLRCDGIYISVKRSKSLLRVSKSTLRERFKAFNSMFEEVHRIQATWLVPSTYLREDLWISISEKLIPAYRTISGRFRDIIEREGLKENYVKYSVVDLENAVLDLFEGRPVSQPLRRRLDGPSSLYSTR